MTVPFVRRLGSLGVMACLTLLTGRAAAQTWIAGGGGSWSVGGNWVGGSAPTSGTTTALTFGDPSIAAMSYTATNDIGTGPFQLNSLTFNNNAGTTVTIAGLDPVVNGLNFVGTAPTITMGAGNATITSAVTLSATTTISGGAGTLTFGNTMSDGGGGFNLVMAASGALVFSSAGTSSFNQLSLQGGTTSVTGGTLALTAPTGTSNAGSGLQLGAAAGQTASFAASGGALINVTENVYIGDVAGSTGTVTLTGAGTAMNNTIGAASGRFAVGNSGNGTLNILNGAALTTRFLLTNRTAGTTGTILVDGTGSTLTVVTNASGAGTVQIASNTVGSTGSLTVQNGGAVNVTGTISAAGAASANATITVQNGGTISSSSTFSMAAGASSTGSFSILGGSTATITGGFTGASGAGSSGTVLISGAGSSLSVGGQFALSISTGIGTVNVQQGGSLTLGGTGFIGVQPGGVGTINVSGVGSTFTQTGLNTVLEFGGGATPGGKGILNLTNGATGSSTGVTVIAFQAGTTGMMNVLSGASFSTPSIMLVGAVGASGANAAATGTITVSGAGSSLSANAIQIGGDEQILLQNPAPGGTGTMNITAGGAVTTTGFLVGNSIGSVGTALVDAATLNVPGQVFVGYGANNATAVAGACTGTMTVQNGSTVNITGADAELVVGLFAGSTGAMTIQGGSTVTLAGNGFVGLSAAVTGSPAFPTAVGTLNVSGIGTTLTVTGAANALIIGGGNGGGSGFLNVTNGAVVTTPFLTIGNDPTSTGAVVVSNATLIVTTELDLGDGGNATLSIQNGGTVLVGGNAFPGPTTAVTGAITLTGAQSSLTVLGAAVVGGDFDATTGNPLPGGTGSITANAGTRVNLGPTFLFGGATLTVNTGTLGNFTVAGLDDGVTGSSVGSVAVGSGSTLTIDTSNNPNLLSFFSGVISGAGGVTKTGLGTQVFTGGVNTYTGPTGINGGVLAFGTLNDLGLGTAINFNGGTLQYGTNTDDISVRTVTINAGGATIDTDGNNVTFANPIGNNGPGGLTKTGPGTLTLAAANTYGGVTTVLNGTLSVASDANLGISGSVAGATAGILSFTGTTTTSRAFAMNGGTIAVAAGKVVTFNGSQVSGATLDGAGTFATNPTTGAQFIDVTTTPSVSITSNSAKDQFVNFTNGADASGATHTGLTVAPGINTAGTSTVTNFNGFVNRGSGSVTIGAASVVNVSAFQSDGVLTLNPAVVGSGQFTEIVNTGPSQLFFNDGSRTFLGTPATAGPPSAPNFVAGIDLHGQNAIVAGGLFVNNGFVVDSTNSGTGTATIVADFGALVKGAGFFQNTIVTQNGGKVQAGNSPGSISFGQFVFGPGGVSNYVFAIDDATGTAGPSPNAAGLVSGWGLINAIRHSIGVATTTGDFTWTADPTNKLTVAIDTLVNPTTVGTDVAGMMANFNPNAAYSWPAAQWTGTYSGPTDVATLDAATSFDTSGFLNPVVGTFGWSLDSGNQTLSLTYTPSAVPEPSTLAMVGATAAVAWLRRRRRSVGDARTVGDSSVVAARVHETRTFFVASAFPGG
jgi:fibronectin-binding autotransporter adhesin